MMVFILLSLLFYMILTFIEFSFMRYDLGVIIFNDIASIIFIVMTFYKLRTLSKKMVNQILRNNKKSDSGAYIQNIQKKRVWKGVTWDF